VLSKCTRAMRKRMREVRASRFLSAAPSSSDVYLLEHVALCVCRVQLKEGVAKEAPPLAKEASVRNAAEMQLIKLAPASFCPHMSHEPHPARAHAHTLRPRSFVRPPPALPLLLPVPRCLADAERLLCQTTGQPPVSCTATRHRTSKHGRDHTRRSDTINFTLLAAHTLLHTRRAAGGSAQR